MDEDDLTLSPDPLAEPLPMAPQTPAPPQQQPMGWKNAGPLMALLPLAMKQGGQAAVAALLQGFQQGQQRKQMQGQQDWQNQRVYANDQANRQYQTDVLSHRKANDAATLEAAKRREMQAAMQRLTESVKGATTPDEALAYAQQAIAAGVPAELATNTTMQIATPSRMEITTAKTRVEQLKATFGQAAFNEMASQQPPAIDQKTGKTIPQLLSEAQLAVEGVQAKPANAPNVGSFEDYVLRQFGQNPTAAQILQARKDYQQSDDRPRVDVNLNGMNPRQVTTFNQIAGAYQRSPLILASDRTLVLDDTIQAIRSNPNDASSQLSLAYGFIQILDSYQSAVREGELQLARGTASIIDQLKMQAGRVTTGAVIPPSTALQMADTSERMIAAIKEGKRRKQQEFASRARVSGVGEMWDEFVRGAEAQTTAAPPAPTDGRATVTPATGGPVAPPAGGNPFRGRGAGPGR